MPSSNFTTPAKKSEESCRTEIWNFILLTANYKNLSDRFHSSLLISVTTSDVRKFFIEKMSQLFHCVLLTITQRFFVVVFVVIICDLIIKFRGWMDGAIMMRCPSLADKKETRKTQFHFPIKLPSIEAWNLHSPPIFFKSRLAIGMKSHSCSIRLRRTIKLTKRFSSLEHFPIL